MGGEDKVKGALAATGRLGGGAASKAVFTCVLSSPSLLEVTVTREGEARRFGTVMLPPVSSPWKLP